jgi:thioredoxin reductase
MHYDLIIISDFQLEDTLLENLNYLHIDSKHYLLTPFETNNHLTFDYLIFSNLETIKELEILIDNHQVITNYYFQTNFDHLFAIGKINGSNFPLEIQLKRILEFLINPI